MGLLSARSGHCIGSPWRYQEAQKRIALTLWWHMRNPGLVFYLVAIGSLFQPLSAHAATSECTRALTKQALGSNLVAHDWHDMHVIYEKYGVCDDGALAEELSDMVVDLLVNHWDKFDGLNDLVAQDKGFEKFVLRHIDQLMSPTDYKSIVDAASKNCPPYGKALCADLLLRTKELAAEP